MTSRSFEDLRPNDYDYETEVYVLQALARHFIFKSLADRGSEMWADDLKSEFMEMLPPEVGGAGLSLCHDLIHFMIHEAKELEIAGENKENRPGDVLVRIRRHR